jgi:eukaryotic-like serine/threonine-protein kinase
MDETQSDDIPGHHDPLGELIVTYLDGLALGEPVNRSVLLAQHPGLAEELACFFANHDRFAVLADRWCSETTGDLAPRSKRSLTAEASAEGVTLSVTPRREDATPSEFPGDWTSVSAGRAFGDYELLEEIGRGGMGIVYRARQISLDRTVAIKMLRSGELAGEDEIRRFQAEAEAAACLQHPCIVGIYEVGRWNNQRYLSMEYVSGKSLAEISRPGPLPPKQAARYMRQIAEAIEFAHCHGVLHRDIKPSNVLVDDKDQARVTDFGLAKRIEIDQKLTHTGQVLGTPSYMAPEQAAGAGDQVGPLSDVYSIGAVLYELLTGKPPFKGRTAMQTLTQVCEHNPKLPRQLNPNAPRELELICLKCLEKNPRDRYASAGDLADDFERYLNGDSLSITGPHLLDRVVRALERSHHDVEFMTWARMLFHFAWIVPAANLLVFVLQQAGWASVAMLAVLRLAEFAAMGWVFWCYRNDWFPPQGKPARQLWALWLGYVAGSIVLLLVEHRLHEPFSQESLYPKLAVLGSLGFIMMGSSYWGYCYVIGGGFLLLALLMPLNLALAPVMFGLGWAASLLALARHLGKLAREVPGGPAA